MLTYAALAALWILVSDRLLAWTGPHTVLVSSLKGLAFVIATSCLLYVLVSRHSARLADSEASTREREQELAAIYENAPVLMTLLDHDRRISKTNRAAQLRTGESEPSLVGRRYGEALRCLQALRSQPGCELAPVCEDCVIRRSVIDTFEWGRDHRQVEATVPVVGPLGPETATFLLSTTRLVAHGRPMVLATVEDITERKRAEKAVRRANADLRNADRRKNDFLAILSHELRNPLAPIRNSLHVLGRAPAGSEQARRAQAIIDRQVNHLTRLIEDLLDVTRIARGKVRLQRTRIDLRDLLQRTADDHRSLFADSGVGFLLEVAGEPIPVYGDPARLGQAIGNLLQNAVKFTPRGGSARLSAERRPEEAVVIVRDTGIGIDPAVAPDLFEPFVQSDDTLDRARGGLGLGLAVVKSLVELHGGTVRAQSDGIGRGAEFVVTLPLDRRRRPRAQPAGAPVRGAAPRRRVLVVEDNPDAATSLEDLLTMLGHDVQVAHTGSEALEKGRAAPPDLVLCDIGLPGMDGYEVARTMRGDPVLASVHLVALSGYALAEDVENARRAGFDEHLSKPPALHDLERLLASLPSPDAGREARAEVGGRGGRPARDS